MTRTQASGARAVLVSGHPLATGAGLQVLRDGGNAIDGAVAAALVLMVVAPYACSLAGDAFLLIGSPDGAIHGLNGTGRAPAAVDAADGAEPPRSGPRSATVPGTLAALADALARFGTRSIGELLPLAIALAREGFVVNPYFTRNIVERRALLAADPVAASVFLPDGAPLASGTRFVQPALAESLETLTRDGVNGFYRGAFACRFAAAIGDAGGWLSAADLAAHASLWQDPIAAPFFGRKVWTMPPNSYGITLLFQLLELERSHIELTAGEEPLFVEVGYAARRAAYAAAIGLVGDPAVCEAVARTRLTALLAGEHPVVRPFAEATDRCTTNVVAMDADGWSVSLIQSISTPFGAGCFVGNTGIVLNNRLAGFGAAGSGSNGLAPGRRPAHTLAPCLVTHEGRVIASIGTPGTVGQTCVLAQYLARTLARGEPPADAIASPRWSADFDGSLVIEDTMPADAIAALEAAGLVPKPRREGWISFGSLKVAERAGDGFRGFADHRRLAAAGAI